MYIQIKPPECVDIHHEVFTAGAVEARLRRTRALMPPAVKTEWIVSTHECRFVFIIHRT